MKRIRSLLPAKAATLLLLGCTGGDVSVNTDLSSVPLDIPALSILATSVGEVKVFDLSAEPPVTRLVAGGFDFPARSRAPQAALVPFGQFDQASGRLELTDFNAALYVSGQKLFVISLNQPDAPPQQVSSAENVCGIRDLFSDHADRSNSLVLIFRAAPDGRCFTSASPQALVRLGAPVSEDPITVSRDFRARSRVYDSSGRLRAILVLDRQPSSGMLELQRIALGAGPTTAQVLATRRTIIE
ncbi:MAG: hypothetical protein ACREUF_04485, partial [Solimonas sp.]